jgi:hypothetical protein
MTAFGIIETQTLAGPGYIVAANREDWSAFAMP